MSDLMLEPRYLRIARTDIGVQEVPGPATAPRIREMLSCLGTWWGDDETPWCGVAMAAWLSQAGHPYPRSFYRAREWAEYGIEVGAPLLGAIAVLSRRGGGHVGLVTAVTQDWEAICLLGGNQSDSVSEAWFPIGRVLTFRVPDGVALREAPVRALGTKSRREC